MKRVKQRKKQLSTEMQWQNYDSIKHGKDVGGEIRDSELEVKIIWDKKGRKITTSRCT
jgi:hypothetical protein